MIDSTIFTVTYTYRSKLAERLPCNMTNSAIVEGSHNVESLLETLRQAGITNITVEVFRAPVFGTTLSNVFHALREYPVISADPDPVVVTKAWGDHA